MDSAERRDIVSSGVAAAVKEFCDARSAAPADVAAKAPSQDPRIESPKSQAASR
jgi:hypothetical protein